MVYCKRQAGNVPGQNGPRLMMQMPEGRFNVQNGGVELQKVSERHLQIGRLKATGQFTNREIAEILGVTAQMVGYTLKQPEVVELMRRLGEVANVQTLDMMQKIRSHGPDALDEVVNIMNNDFAKDEVRLRAAKDLLDRGGFAFNMLPEGQQGAITKEDLRDVKDRAKAMAKRSGMLAEAVVIEESQDGGPHDSNSGDT